MSFLIKKMEESVFYLFSGDRCLKNERKESICEEIEKISTKKKHFKHEILTIILNKKKKLIKAEVRVYQTCLCRILNVLYFSKCDECYEKECYESYRKPLIVFSIDLLKFLKEQYDSFFDYNKKLPKVVHYIEIKELSRKVELIDQIQKPMSDNSCKVSTIIKPLLESLSKQYSQLFTFHEKYHTHKLLDRIISVLKSEESIPSIKEHLFQIFITYNWNTIEAIECLSRYIKSKIEEGNNEDEKLEIIQSYYKWINQIYCPNEYGYIKKNDSLQSVLSNWLKYEIDFYKEKNHLSTSLTNTTFKPGEIIFPEKIKTTLSVAQIASFIRQLIDSGIIEAKSKESVLQYFIHTISSKNSKDISLGSIKTKFYSPDASVDDSMKEIFYKLYKSM